MYIIMIIIYQKSNENPPWIIFLREPRCVLGVVVPLGFFIYVRFTEEVQEVKRNAQAERAERLVSWEDLWV